MFNTYLWGKIKFSEIQLCGKKGEGVNRENGGPVVECLCLLTQDGLSQISTSLLTQGRLSDIYPFINTRWTKSDIYVFINTRQNKSGIYPFINTRQTKSDI